MNKKNEAKAKKKTQDEDVVPNLAYQSLFDEAMNMAFTLQDIDAELRMAARCEGDYPGGYSSKELLPNLCKIMYADPGYWNAEKYRRHRRPSI